MAARLRAWWSSLATLLLIGAVVFYAYAARPKLLGWGATADERSDPLPGDSLVVRPDHVATRALTIDAPPDRVWPWLVQMGQDKAAFYSYTWIENLLGLRYRNAARIHPEWQDLRRGGFIRSAPPGFLFGLVKDGPGKTGWSVPIFEPERVLNLQPGWGSFVLEPLEGGRTRFIVRTRVPRGSPVLKPLGFFVLDAAHFFMEKRLMLEVKRLAEGRPGTPGALTALAHAGFLALAVLVSFFLRTRRGRRGGLVLPTAWAAFVLIAARDAQAALVAYTALAIAVAAFLRLGAAGWSVIAFLWVFSYAVLFLAADAYIVFGLVFLALAAAAAVLLFRPKRPSPA